ncbi:hypothetical protein AG1IA_07335 [Rhizoctonia solani AG-1 IA]|uniref:ER membrane protein complex subunit 2 n=1 Tax=Thanatephorus cucumeris (strain AG1-IA) TaxID=983506 RepID=L8WPD5_THACA|nr:hypothetical protein AG1IA_07335 [Rhizoctonia solani AG-1 IA]
MEVRLAAVREADRELARMRRAALTSLPLHPAIPPGPIVPGIPPPPVAGQEPLDGDSTRLEKRTEVADEIFRGEPPLGWYEPHTGIWHYRADTQPTQAKLTHAPPTREALLADAVLGGSKIGSNSWGIASVKTFMELPEDEQNCLYRQTRDLPRAHLGPHQSLHAMTEVFQRFATYRSHGTRSSVEIVREGEPLLLNEKYRSADDRKLQPSWAFLEQLAFAAMDVGRLDIADDCLVLLDQQFPDSPRVTVLKGQRLEADGMLQDALKMYVYYLTKEDENYVVRDIILRKSGGGLTFLTSPIFVRYDNSLSALAHAQLIAPQTPQIALCSAETAYTTGDIDLALKSFLRAAELCGSGPGIQPGGTETRAWLGVKLVLLSCTCPRILGVRKKRRGSFLPRITPTSVKWRASRLRSGETSWRVCIMTMTGRLRFILYRIDNGSGDSSGITSKLPSSAKNPKLLEELSTERILAAYSKTDGEFNYRGKPISSSPTYNHLGSAKPNDAGRAAMLRWLGASQTPK